MDLVMSQAETDEGDDPEPPAAAAPANDAATATEIIAAAATAAPPPATVAAVAVTGKRSRRSESLSNRRESDSGEAASRGDDFGGVDQPLTRRSGRSKRRLNEPDHANEAAINVSSIVVASTATAGERSEPVADPGGGKGESEGTHPVRSGRVRRKYSWLGLDFDILSRTTHLHASRHTPCTLLSFSGRVHLMLIGDRTPMLCPIHIFRPQLYSSTMSECPNSTAKPAPSNNPDSPPQKANQKKKYAGNHHAANIQACPPGMKRIFRCADKGDKWCKTCEGYWQTANMLRGHMKVSKHGQLPVSEKDGTFIPIDDFVTFPKQNNGNPAWAEAAADAAFAAAKAIAASTAAAAAAASAAAATTAAAAAAAMKAPVSGSARSKSKGNGIIHVNVGAGTPARTSQPSLRLPASPLPSTAASSTIASAAASACQSTRDSSRASSRKQARGAKDIKEFKVSKVVKVAMLGVSPAGKRGNGARSDKAPAKAAELVVKPARPATNDRPKPIELLPAGEPVVMIYLNGACVSQVRKIEPTGPQVTHGKCGDVMPLLFSCESCRERGKTPNKLLNTSNKIRNHLRTYHSKMLPLNWYSVLCRRWETMRPGQLRSKIHLLPLNMASTLAGSGSVSNLRLIQGCAGSVGGASAGSGERPPEAPSNTSTRQPIAAVDGQVGSQATAREAGPKPEQQKRKLQPKLKHQPLAAWLAEQPRWAAILAAVRDRTVEQMYPKNMEPQSTPERGSELYVSDAGMARYDRWCVELQKHRLIWVGLLSEEVADEPDLAEADPEFGPEPACPQMCRETLERAVTCGRVLGKNRSEQIHHIYVSDNAFDDHVFTREQGVAKVNARKQAKRDVAKLTKLASPMSSPIRTSTPGLPATSSSPSPSQAVKPTPHRLPFPAAVAEPGVTAVVGAVVGQGVTAAMDGGILQHEGDAGDRPAADTARLVTAAVLGTAPPLAAAIDLTAVAEATANALATMTALPGAQADGTPPPHATSSGAQSDGTPPPHATTAHASSSVAVTPTSDASATPAPAPAASAATPRTIAPAPTLAIVGAAVPADPQLKPSREPAAQSSGCQAAAGFVQGFLGTVSVQTDGKPRVCTLPNVAAAESTLEPPASSTSPTAAAASAPVVPPFKPAAAPNVVAPKTTARAPLERADRIAQVQPPSAAPPNAATVANVKIPSTQPVNVSGVPNQPAVSAGNAAAVSPGGPANPKPDLADFVSDHSDSSNSGDRGGGGAPGANLVPAVEASPAMTPGGQERPRVSAVPSAKKPTPKRSAPAKRGHGTASADADAGRDTKKAREAVPPLFAGQGSGATPSAATAVAFMATAAMAMQATSQPQHRVGATVAAPSEQLQLAARADTHPVLLQHAVAYTSNTIPGMQPVVSVPASYQLGTTQAAVPATHAPAFFVNPQQQMGQQTEQQMPAGAAQGMPVPEHTGYVPQSQPRN